MQNHSQMLQQMLKDKDAEVEDLRNRLMDDSPSAAGPPAPSPEQQTKALEDKTQWDVDDLSAFLEQHKLLELDPMGEAPPAQQ